MNIHENNTDDILVIGSGVIGLFCAYTLQKNGFQLQFLINMSLDYNALLVMQEL